MLTDPALKGKVYALWDRFWSGNIVNPIMAIEQMSYIIFLRQLEDMDNAQSATVVVQSMFLQRRRLNLGDLYEESFTNFGANAVKRLFGESEITELIE